MILHQRAHGDDDNAGLCRSPVGGHRLQTVRQNRGDLLALGDAVGEQYVRQAVNRSVQFSVGQPLVAHHQRKTIWAVVGVTRQQSANAMKHSSTKGRY